MGKTITKFSIIAFAYLAVLYPIFIRFQNLNWSLVSGNFLEAIFPIFGLAAFSILWLHVISGVFEPKLRKIFDFDRYVRITSILVLISIILHPLLLLISLDFKVNNIFLFYGAKFIWLAIIAWLLLITYDIGKIFKKYDFFVQNWNNILLISTIGFLLTFIHSISLGSDLQSGPLRYLWLFYGITAIIATIYSYGLKRLLKNS